MPYQPSSLKEAKTHRYGKWAGYPSGNPYNPKKCACHSMTGGRGSLPTQCSGKPGHGPDGIYCKVHALEHFPEAVATWYKARKDYYTIEPVQVASFTDKTINLMVGKGSRRCNLENDYERYFPSFEEAKGWLAARLERQIESAKSNLLSYEKSLEEVKSKTTTQEL